MPNNYNKGGKSVPQVTREGDLDLLPWIQSPDELNDYIPERDDSPYIIKGVLREGSKMALSSCSKGGKTWMLIDIALSVSSGTTWMGYDTQECKVLYLNVELKEGTFKKRLELVRDARAIRNHQIYAIHLRGQTRDIKQIVEQTKKQVLDSQFKLIIIDPVYKSYGTRKENDTSDMAAYLSEVEKWCAECNASVIWSGHFPKGNMENRQGNDRQAGSSVFARDPDVVANYMLDATGKYVMEFSGIREDAPIPSFYMNWSFPVFFKLDGTVKDAIKKDKQLKIDDFMDCLVNECEGSASPSAWLEAYNKDKTDRKIDSSNPKVSYESFRKTRSAIYELKLIDEVGAGKKIICKVSKKARKNPENGHWFANFASQNGKVEK